MRRSITATSASRCTARRRPAGRRSRRRPIHRSRKGSRRTTCGAGRWPGARRESGHSHLAAPTEPGEIWCGTLPGGLFRSTDHGDSWQMVRSLWDHPKRRTWMGGGADLPGLHSIIVDPRDSKRDLDRGVDRRHLVHRGRWRDLEPARRGHARRPRAARADARSDRAGRALPGAMPGRAEPHVGAASQRHLRLFRRGPQLHRDHGGLARRRSASPSPSIRGSRTPPGSCPRSRTRSASRAMAGSW